MAIEYCFLVSFNLIFLVPFYSLEVVVLQLNSGIYITDNVTDFSVLVDRSMGGSSINDGELEVMVHRSALILYFIFTKTSWQPFLC
jgi:hypothetical protein